MPICLSSRRRLRRGGISTFFVYVVGVQWVGGGVGGMITFLVLADMVDATPVVGGGVGGLGG